ncbi:MAG: ABC transporter permease [Candidatus Saccharibacteria bacterium]|nr:ABC transporter permease [Candidatus Saccharibacteria bacterium]
MLLGGYVKLARFSMKSARWRSLLTMLGIIVGIVSVVTTISIGEGVKRQVVQQINERGEDLITILPGETDTENASTYFSRLSPSSSRPNISFGESDYQAVREVPELAAVAPFGYVSGEVAEQGDAYDDVRVVATTEDFTKILQREVAFGSFITGNEAGSANGAVIGQGVAEGMFGENVPLGRSFTIRDTRFIVRGVYESFEESSPLLSTDNYDDTIFIPHRLGQELMGGNMQIYQMLARARGGAENASVAIEETETALSAVRGNSRDSSVLKQSETLSLAEETLTLLTTMIAGVAAISLLVGGIGIMNIMLVSVTERTREIGVRKAVGATNRQVMYQFITEAAVLSLIGGILGILLSLGTNFLLRVTTNLEPVITAPIMGLAVVVAFVVGVVFGAAPAFVAARKDPIDSLRYE